MRRQDLYALGVSRSRLSAHLAAGRWRAVTPAVISLNTGPLSPVQRQWVAVLHAGPVSALAGRTAAEAVGLVGWESSLVEIVVPRGRVVPDVPGLALRVHESRRFDLLAIHPTRSPRQTRIERSVVDAAAWSASPRTACALLAAAVQQRLTTAARLERELLRAGMVRHRRVMRAALSDIAGGAQALSELDFTGITRRLGLPPPLRQQIRRDGSGRRRYLDVTLRGPDGRLLHVEIDGALHLLVRSYWDDMRRGNELVIAGERFLRFPSVALRLDEEVVVGQVARALGLSVTEHARAS